MDSTDESGDLYPSLGKVKFNFNWRNSGTRHGTLLGRKQRIDIYLYLSAQVISTYLHHTIIVSLKSQFA